MGLINFRDRKGTGWRVWHVDMPAERAHLMDAVYRKGWLVFEREDETERRRLSRVPDDWASWPPDRLASLLEEATPVTMRNSPTGQLLAQARPPARDTSG